MKSKYIFIRLSSQSACRMVFTRFLANFSEHPKICATLEELNDEMLL